MTAQPLAAQPVEVPPAQPAPAPVHHQPAPMHNAPYYHKPFLDQMFGSKAIVAMVFVGIILMFVGGMLCVMSKVTAKTDVDDALDETEKAYTNFKIGAFLMVLGIMFMVLFMLGGAIVNNELPVNVRVGFLIFCAFMIFVTVTVVLGFITPLKSTGPDILDYT